MVALMERCRVLVPLSALGTAVGMLGLSIFVVRTYQDIKFPLRFAIDGVGALVVVSLALVVFIRLIRTQVRGAIVYHLQAEGIRLVCLCTQWRRLPELVTVLRKRPDLNMPGVRAQALLALLSWQELVVVLGAFTWAGVAFVPGLFSCLPFLDVWGWWLLQAGLAWRDLWGLLGQVVLITFAALYGFVMVFDYCKRINDQRAVAYCRPRMPGRVPVDDDEGPRVMPFPPQIGRATDTDDEDTWAKRIEAIWARAMQPPDRWERLGLPCPNYFELHGLATVTFGFVTWGAADWLAEPGSTLHAVLSAPSTGLAAWWGAIRSWSPEALGLTVAALVLFYIIVAGYTASADKEWLQTYEHYCWEYRASVGRKADFNPHAWNATVQDLGSRPKQLHTAAEWLWEIGRSVLGIAWGSAIAAALLKPAHIAAYGLPGSYGDLGARSLTSAACPKSWRISSTGTHPANVTTWAAGWLGVGGCDAASGFGSRWWCEVATGAKVNLLAARAWRRGGMDGTQAALEALRAARCSGEAVLRRRREVEQSTAAQLQEDWGTAPSAEELREATLSALEREGSADAPAKSLWTALTALSGIANEGMAELPWTLNGDWALGLAWEKVRAKRPAEPLGEVKTSTGSGKKSSGPSKESSGGDAKSQRKAAATSTGGSTPAPEPAAVPVEEPPPAHVERLFQAIAPWLPPWQYVALALAAVVVFQCFKALFEYLDSPADFFWFLFELVTSPFRRSTDEDADEPIPTPRLGGKTKGKPAAKAAKGPGAAAGKAKEAAAAGGSSKAPSKGQASSPSGSFSAGAGPSRVAGAGEASLGPTAVAQPTVDAPEDSEQPAAAAAPSTSSNAAQAAQAPRGKGKGKGGKAQTASKAPAPTTAPAATKAAATSNGAAPRGPAPPAKEASAAAATARAAPPSANGASTSTAAAALAEALPFTASLGTGGGGSSAAADPPSSSAANAPASPAAPSEDWRAPPPPPAAVPAPAPSRAPISGIFRGLVAPRSWGGGPPPAAAGASSPPPPASQRRPEVTIPVPVPVPDSSPAAAQPTSQPRPAAPLMGLNPALAQFLVRRPPAPPPTNAPPASAPAPHRSAAAKPDTPATKAPAAAGPTTGAAPRPDGATLCSACGAAPRQMAVLHSASAGQPPRACYCLCMPCSEAFKGQLGAPCPSCGEPSERVMRVF
ncbi:hypothetical protein HYH03_003017 [Edaphochlamys debaryana]|uniref:Uncharacterized protein n=1 Tax=Edaphochlamys debaryana TaxID=47281 RepID=A0A835YBT0_9CHLO|nr:hypothetical protein HYH03_003017 [Edaphochlamys debaryana]|eukprot:KAG2498824.1 hypothetical protein HYH03_003017 [Edaphochlamys debaryana]